MDLRKSTGNAVRPQLIERSTQNVRKHHHQRNHSNRAEVPAAHGEHHESRGAFRAYAVRRTGPRGGGGRIFVNVDSMSEFFAACTLAPEEGKPVIPAEPAEKPSFARPAKGIRRIG